MLIKICWHKQYRNLALRYFFYLYKFWGGVKLSGFEQRIAAQHWFEMTGPPTDQSDLHVIGYIELWCVESI